jgi:hypothetical protein
MTTDAAITMLLNHANLRSSDDAHSILHALWLRERGAAHPDLLSLSADVLSCLVELNLRWNTSNPDAIEGKSAVMEREAVASLAEIVGEGLEYTRKHPADAVAFRAIHRISIAWQAVLAGDIVDLIAEVDSLEIASGL